MGRFGAEQLSLATTTPSRRGSNPTAGCGSTWSNGTFKTFREDKQQADEVKALSKLTAMVI